MYALLPVKPFKYNIIILLLPSFLIIIFKLKNNQYTWRVVIIHKN